MRSDRRTTVAALYVALMPRGDWGEGLSSSFEAKKRILVGTLVESNLNGYIILIDIRGHVRMKSAKFSGFLAPLGN